METAWRRIVLLASAALFSPLCVLAGPEAAGPWTVKVLVVRYFPLAPGGGRLDIRETSNVGDSLDAIVRRCDRITGETAAALEEGSRYHAYSDPASRPSLRYEVVDTLTRLEAEPRDPRKPKRPDYERILREAGVERWVMERGVREVWIWGYDSPALSPWESNMASRWGDVSNSDRDAGDLPVFAKTYTVFHYNYQRDTSEAVHDHLHQIEALLRSADPELMRRFEGTPGHWRAGNCHFPPNGRKDYDWDNLEPVLSDIEDWRPEGTGRLRPLNAARWGGDSLRWFLYWMQSIPGAGNGVSWRGRPLTNWWLQVGDYDGARSRGLGLVER